ncbi:MAG: hypothetical protein WKG01_12665 [Kofleriaceae bacterium]
MIARALILCVIAACGSDAPERPRTFGGDRFVDLRIPADFEDGRRYPLVVVLHGYTINGVVQEAYLGTKALVDAGDAFVVAPTGTYNSQNKPFWNADPACCDFEGQAPDDVDYLATLIEDIADAWPIDRDAVHVVGHANGGFMAYRLACERAELMASIIVIAGAASLDPAACQPARPVNVLHLHGTADIEFPYAGGGMFGGTPDSPGAVESVTRWAAHDGCDATRTPGPTIDLDTTVAGAETRTESFGCPAGRGVELWSLEGTEHLPNVVSTFVPAVWPWLLAHVR